MATPHKNYYPPAGSVEVAGDPSWSWDGRRWMHQGRVAVPTGRSLVGRRGGQLDGWHYDWRQYAWIEPTPAHHYPPAGSSVVHQPAHAPIIQIHQQPAHPAPQHHTEVHHVHREHQPESFASELKKHPWWPLVGGIVYLLPEFISEPQPPPVSAEMPHYIQTQLQFQYAQELARYQKRMKVIEKVGALVMGGSVAGLVTKAESENVKHISEHHAHPHHVTQNQAPTTTYPTAAQHRAM
jgi:hypothetical protein